MTQECTLHEGKDLIKIAGVTIVPPLKVTWNAATNTGTFDMPGADVVLTPVYAQRQAELQVPQGRGEEG